MSYREEWIKGKTIADRQLGISLFIDIDSCFCLSSYIQYIQTPYTFFFGFALPFHLFIFIVDLFIVLLLFFFLFFFLMTCFFLNRWDLIFGKNGARHLCILHVLLKDSFYASVFVFNQFSFFFFLLFLSRFIFFPDSFMNNFQSFISVSVFFLLLFLYPFLLYLRVFFLFSSSFFLFLYL